MSNRLDNLTEIGARFQDYLHYKRIGVNEAGRMLDTSGSQVSNIIKGKKYGTDKLLSIFDVFTDLNIEWMLYGKGEMLFSNAKQPELVGAPSGGGGERVLPRMQMVPAAIEECDIDELREMVMQLLSENEELREENLRQKDKIIELYAAREEIMKRLKNAL